MRKTTRKAKPRRGDGGANAAGTRASTTRRASTTKIASAATPRRFVIEASGLGGELGIARLTRSQHRYWSSKGDLRAYAFGEDHPAVPEAQRPCEPGEWRDACVVLHLHAAELDESNRLVVRDEQGEEAWSSALADEALAEAGVPEEGGSCEEVYLSEVEDGDFLAVFRTIEKGVLLRGTIETRGEFDPSKLSIAVVDVDGTRFLGGLTYAGSPIEREDFDTVLKDAVVELHAR